MDQPKQLTRELKEFHYKIKLIERYLYVVILIIFFYSFNNTYATIAFYSVSVILLAYYIIWFRKKPPYVKILGDEITVHEGIFFKPVVLKTDILSKVKLRDRRIRLIYNSSEGKKKVDVLNILLEDDDRQQLIAILRPFMDEKED